MSPDISPEQYKELGKKAEHKSSLFKDCLTAFLVGGLICTLGQVLNTVFENMGMAKDDAGALTSMSLIFLAALLTGIGVFDKIAMYAGAGTLVPITGFSNSIASPAMDFKSEGLITGLAVKMFTIAGPVIVYGTVAGVVYGLIAYFFGLY